MTDKSGVNAVLSGFINLLTADGRTKADLLIESKHIVALREQAADEYKKLTDDERDTVILEFGEQFTKALGG